MLATGARRQLPPPSNGDGPMRKLNRSVPAVAYATHPLPNAPANHHCADFRDAAAGLTPSSGPTTHPSGCPNILVDVRARTTICWANAGAWTFVQAKGNPVELRGCPAAVIENEPHGRTGHQAGKQWEVGTAKAPSS
jgi:hypothetical protein